MKFPIWSLNVLLLSLGACDELSSLTGSDNQPAVASAAQAKSNQQSLKLNPECSEVFTGNHSMVYDKNELTINVSRCPEFTVVVRNIGHLPRDARGHNFVIAKDTDEAGILADGMDLGAASDFLKPGDARIIAHTKLAGGGEQQHVTFKTDAFKQGNNYVFFCSFLGHHKMRGKVNIIY